MPEKFENAALFLWLDLLSMLIRHKNGAGRKHSLSWRNLKTTASHFLVNENVLKMEFFKNRWRCNSLVISLTMFSKMTGDRCIFKFLQLSVNGKHLMHFQSETSVFKFLQCSLDGALESAALKKGCFID